VVITNGLGMEPGFVVFLGQFAEDISMNWRGRALATREIIVSLIGETKSKSGLKIRAALDEGIYPTGRKVSDQEMSQIKLTRADFQPAWNYKISPK